jgi:hypothetical protein
MSTTISKTSTASTNTALDEFFAKVDPVRARLMFAIDATASRQSTWDRAAHLQSQMFSTVAAIGGLSVRLVYYRGEECVKSKWTSDPKALAVAMSGVYWHEIGLKPGASALTGRRAQHDMEVVQMKREQQQARVLVPREIEPWAAYRNSKSRRAEERSREQFKKKARVFRGEEEQDEAAF